MPALVETPTTYILFISKACAQIPSKTYVIEQSGQFASNLKPREDFVKKVARINSGEIT